MSKETKATSKVAEKKVPTFSREQLLQYPDFSVGERAFIGALPDKFFPSTVEDITKVLKGGKF